MNNNKYLFFFYTFLVFVSSKEAFQYNGIGAALSPNAIQKLMHIYLQQNLQTAISLPSYNETYDAGFFSTEFKVTEASIQAFVYNESYFKATAEGDDQSYIVRSTLNGNETESFRINIYYKWEFLAWNFHLSLGHINITLAPSEFQIINFYPPEGSPTTSIKHQWKIKRTLKSGLLYKEFKSKLDFVYDSIFFPAFKHLFDSTIPDSISKNHLDAFKTTSSVIDSKHANITFQVLTLNTLSKTSYKETTSAGIKGIINYLSTMVYIHPMQVPTTIDFTCDIDNSHDLSLCFNFGFIPALLELVAENNILFYDLGDQLQMESFYEVLPSLADSFPPSLSINSSMYLTEILSIDSAGNMVLSFNLSFSVLPSNEEFLKADIHLGATFTSDDSLYNKDGVFIGKVDLSAEEFEINSCYPTVDISGRQELETLVETLFNNEFLSELKTSLNEMKIPNLCLKSVDESFALSKDFTFSTQDLCIFYDLK